MSTATDTIQEFVSTEYKYGFTSDIETETIPPGLNEEVIRLISAKKNEPEFMLDWRLKAYRHWLTMKEPAWHNVRYPPIDYQGIIYYSAPKQKKQLGSLDEVDPKLLETYAKLGIPLQEQMLLAGVLELVALDNATIKYSTIQNWYPGDKEGKGGIYNFVTKRGKCQGRKSHISWTQVETGSAITWKYPSCILQGDDSKGEFYSVATTNK